MITKHSVVLVLHSVYNISVCSLICSLLLSSHVKLSGDKKYLMKFFIGKDTIVNKVCYFTFFIYIWLPPSPPPPSPPLAQVRGIIKKANCDPASQQRHRYTLMRTVYVCFTVAVAQGIKRKRQVELRYRSSHECTDRALRRPTVSNQFKHKTNAFLLNCHNCTSPSS